MAKKRIYLDYASTTPVDPRVLEAMLPYFTDEFANPSSIYTEGLAAKEVIEKGRSEIAEFLGCSSKEVIFTSGGTESDNLAIFGYLEKFDGGHIITSEIEHPAVYEAFKKLEKKFSVSYLKPDKDGIISSQSLKKVLRKDTIFVSIMYANNEIGTIQPVEQFSKVIKQFKESKLKIKSPNKAQGSKDQKVELGTLDLELAKQYPVLHTDACQAAGYLPMDVRKIGVDMLTFNGSKIYAPKGIGVLYKKSSVSLTPQTVGGEQENLLRAGTENVPAIVGLAKAVSLISNKEAERENKLRDYAIENLKSNQSISFNGSLKKRLPNNINFSIKGVEGESILLDLDRRGIAISTGSACSSRELKPSRVISAIRDIETAHESIRITLGRFTTRRDIDIFINALKQSIKRFITMSPYGRS